MPREKLSESQKLLWQIYNEAAKNTPTLPLAAKADDFHARSIIDKYTKAGHYDRAMEIAAKYFSNPSSFPPDDDPEDLLKGYLFADITARMIAPREFAGYGVTTGEDSTFLFYRSLFNEEQYPTVVFPFDIRSIRGISLPDLMVLRKPRSGEISPKIVATVEITTNPYNDNLDDKQYGLNKDITSNPDFFDPEAFMFLAYPLNTTLISGIKDMARVAPRPISLADYDLREFRDYAFRSARFSEGLNQGMSLQEIFQRVLNPPFSISDDQPMRANGRRVYVDRVTEMRLRRRGEL